jgi:hypothetical protein
MNAILGDIEQAIMALLEDDFRQLCEWMREQDQEKWDRQIAEDSARGAFDDLRKRALQEHREGRTTRL